MRPAEPPGRLLERTGDRAPRGMIATVRKHRTEPGLSAGSASFTLYLLPLRTHARTVAYRQNAARFTPLSQLHDLIQHQQHLGETGIVQTLERMRPAAAQTPIERLGLMAQHVTGLACFATRRLACNHSKRIARVVISRRHRQPDHQRSALVERTGRQHQKWVDIPHLAPCLWITVDPDDVLPVRYPRNARAGGFRHHCSAPMRSAAITSPPCSCGL